MRRFGHKNGVGFTLVELLVVVTVITLLSSIGFALYSNAQKKFRDLKLKTGLDEIVKAYEFKYNEGANQYQDLVPADFDSGQIPKQPNGNYYSSCDRSGCGLNPPKTGFRFCTVLESEGSLYCGVSARNSSPSPENIPCDRFKIGGVPQYPGDAGAVQTCWVSNILYPTADVWIRCGDIGVIIDCSDTTSACFSSSGGNMDWYSSKTEPRPVSTRQVYVYQGDCVGGNSLPDGRWKFQTNVHLRP